MIQYKVLAKDEIGDVAVKEQGCRFGKSFINVDAGESPVLFVRTKDQKKVAAVIVHESGAAFASVTQRYLDEMGKSLSAMGYDMKSTETCLVGGNDRAAWKVRKLRDIVSSYGLTPKELDINGDFYRKINFDLKSGTVSIFREKPDHNAWNPSSATLSLDDGKQVFSKSQTGGIVANVTLFFREKLTFTALRERIVPEHLSLTPNKTLKIWCASCSNGSEAYSYAMYAHRLLTRARAKCGLAVFGTDINAGMIEEAKIGAYDLSKSDIEKYRAYFEEYGKVDGTMVTFGDKIKQFIRFRTFDITNRPCKQRFRFIVCANVFQYYKEDAREVFLTNFASVAQRPGYVFVGPVKPQILDSLDLNMLSKYQIIRVQ